MAGAVLGTSFTSNDVFDSRPNTFVVPIVIGSFGTAEPISWALIEKNPQQGGGGYGSPVPGSRPSPLALGCKHELIRKYGVHNS